MKKHFPALLASFLLITACTPSDRNGGASASSSEEADINVVASIYPVAFLAERIGGTLANVNVITPAGVEPHDFEPSPQEIGSAEDADLFLWNGEGMDPWAEAIDELLHGKSVATVKLTAYPALLPRPEEDGHGHEEEGHESSIALIEGENTVPGDPHVWLSPAIMIESVQTVLQAFVLVDPTHEKEYKKNADALLADLRALDADFTEALSSCALKDVVVSHDAFRYLARDYHFSTVAIAGLSPESEPSPKVMAEIVDLVKKKGIKHVFTETLASPKLSETIANEAGATLLTLNPIEGLTDEQVQRGDTYLTIMRQNLGALTQALQCR